MKKVKVAKWMADTAIARKLHSVLEEKDGQILIETEVLMSSFEEAMHEMVNKMATSYMKNVERQLFVSPEQYENLITSSSTKLTYMGVDVVCDSYIDDDVIYMSSKKEKNNGK
jgi:hypothetical protein